MGIKITKPGGSGGLNVAGDISIVDSGNKFQSTNVENALQEVGTQLADIVTNINNYKTASNTWDDALQAAFNYLRVITNIDKRGGKVLLPSGTFDISPFTMPMRVSIEGMGIGVTVLRLKNGASGNVITFNTNSKFSCLRNLSIDGNKSNCPLGSNGIYFVPKDAGTPHNAAETVNKTEESASTYTYNILENIAVCYTKANGIEINPSYWGSVFKNIFTYECDAHGIYNKTFDIFFDTIQTEKSGLCGIREEGANNRWSNIKAIWNGRLDPVNSAGVYMNAQRLIVNNIEVQDNYCSGLWVHYSKNIEIINLLTDGNGRKYGVADTTTGAFVGDSAFVGVRVKASDHVNIKGQAGNYTAPSCYLQYKAYDVDMFCYDVNIALTETNQYALSNRLDVPSNIFNSDNFLFYGTNNAVPSYDSSGLTVNNDTTYYIDKDCIKEEGMIELIVNVSSAGTYAKFLSENIFSPFNKFLIQKDNNNFVLYFPYIKTDGVRDKAVLTITPTEVFQLNKDINIIVAWHKYPGDNSKVRVLFKVMWDSVVYKIENTISGIKTVATTRNCFGVNASDGNDNRFVGVYKYLHIANKIPDYDMLANKYTIDKKPQNTVLRFDFQNYIPKSNSQLINYTEITGKSTLPTAIAFYRGKTLFVQDDTNGDKIYTCRRKSDATYEWVDLTL